MIIHLLPVYGYQINQAWDMPYRYGRYETLFVRCKKDGKLGKELNANTRVYAPLEVIKGLTKRPYKYKIHFNERDKNNNRKNHK